MEMFEAENRRRLNFCVEKVGHYYRHISRDWRILSAKGTYLCGTISVVRGVVAILNCP